MIEWISTSAIHSTSNADVSQWHFQPFAVWYIGIIQNLKFHYNSSTLDAQLKRRQSAWR